MSKSFARFRYNRSALLGEHTQEQDEILDDIEIPRNDHN